MPSGRRLLAGLFALFLCLILPLGALGAIDTSFATSVGVPQPRNPSRQQVQQRLSRDDAASVSHGISRPIGHATVARIVAVVALFAALIALLAAMPAVAAPWSSAVGDIAAPRGPPVSC